MEQQSNQTTAAKLAKELPQWIEEFESSGKTIDEFLLAKLTAANVKNPKECIAEIRKTLSQIDQNYESLQKAKAEGWNREVWLRKTIDEATKNYTPEETGKVLATSVNALSPEASVTPEPYEGLDAVIQIQQLENAVSENVCNTLASEENE